MKKLLLFYFVLLICNSCKLPNEDKRYSGSEDITFQLKFNPEQGSNYHYDIKSSTETEVELEEKEIKTVNTTTTGVFYLVDKDSLGNYLVVTAYDKVLLYTKNGDLETEADAEKASLNLSPADKMLGALKKSKLTVLVSPTGETKILSGYKELSEELMSTLDANDQNARSIAQQQLDKLIGEGVIKKNVDQLFKMFPDSSIRVGDKWKIDSKQIGDFNLNIRTFYKLKDIDNGVAYITSESEIESDNTPIAMMGASMVPNIKGKQQGKYEVEAKTGMLLNGTITSDIKGNMKMMEREIPLTIEMKVSIEGERIK